MRRRLDLAASLVGRPQMLFLDEPTTGLDPRSRNEMWDIVARLADSGVTVLLTTQYLDEADQLADEIAVVDHGRVIATGTPEELKARRPARRRWPSARSTRPTLPTRDRRRGRARPGRRPRSQRRGRDRAGGRPGACCPRSSAASTTPACVVAELTLRGSSLDEVFLSLTGHRPTTPTTATPATPRPAARRKGAWHDRHRAQPPRPAAGPAGQPGRGPAADLLARLADPGRRSSTTRSSCSTSASSRSCSCCCSPTCSAARSPARRTPTCTFALPGIIVQNALFATLNTGVGLSTDLDKGVFDRLRIAADRPVRRRWPAGSWPTWSSRPGRSRCCSASARSSGFRVGTSPLGGARRVRPAADLHAGRLLDRRAGQHGRGQPGEGADLRLRGAVPAHLHQQRVRADRRRCRAGCRPGSKVNPVTILADAIRGLLVSGPVATPAAAVAAVGGRRSRWCSRRWRCGRSGAGRDPGAPAQPRLSGPASRQHALQRAGLAAPGTPRRRPASPSAARAAAATRATSGADRSSVPRTATLAPSSSGRPVRRRPPRSARSRQRRPAPRPSPARPAARPRRSAPAASWSRAAARSPRPPADAARPRCRAWPGAAATTFCCRQQLGRRGQRAACAAARSPSSRCWSAATSAASASMLGQPDPRRPRPGPAPSSARARSCSPSSHSSGPAGRRKFTRSSVGAQLAGQRQRLLQCRGRGRGSRRATWPGSASDDQRERHAPPLAELAERGQRGPEVAPRPRGGRGRS